MEEPGREKRQLIQEAQTLRRRVAELEAREQSYHALRELQEQQIRSNALRADVSRALAEQERPAPMLQLCAEALVHHLDAALARIWLLSDADQLLVLQASAGLSNNLQGRFSRIPVGSYKIGRIAATQQPHIANDVQSDPYVIYKGWAQEQGIRSFAGYPLLVESRVVGVVGLFARHQLSEAILDTLGAIADALAQGIERKRAEQEVQCLYSDVQNAARHAQQRAQQMQMLAQTFIKITVADSLETIASIITEQAAHIIGAHQALTSLAADQSWTQAIRSIYLSEKYADWRSDDLPTDDCDMYAVLRREQRPVRLTQAELEAHPAWQSCGGRTGRPPPLSGWLAAPLIGRGGQSLGLIQLSDKEPGEFSEEDEFILVQLAQMASVAIENVRLYQEECSARTLTEQALQERDEFLGLAAHELRTPLTAIFGNAQLLQARIDRDENSTARDRRNAKILISQVQRLQRLSNSLLDLSRVEEGRLILIKQQFDLRRLLRDMVEELNLALHSHTLEAHGLSRPCHIVGDQLRLEQVFQNLLQNAVKYSPAGGAIRLDLRCSAQQVTVTITDQGLGIPAADIPRVFERFYRAGNVAIGQLSGMGVGLYVAQEIVTLHEGSMTVESAEGQGSSFRVVLPRQTHERAESQPGVARPLLRGHGS